MILVIGSRALHKAGLIPQSDIENSDWDFISLKHDWDSFRNKMNGYVVEVKAPDVEAFSCIHNGKKTFFESYIVTPETTNTSNYLALMYEWQNPNNQKDELSGFYWASPELCLALKLSHRYKKNTKHFRKTMRHINYLMNRGVRLNDKLELLKDMREKETLNYAHPVLDTTKEKFFVDDFYIYDHDTIHESVKLLDQPAYKFYMKENSQVMTDKEKFFSLPEEIKLAGVYEEACVLALERSQIPYGDRCSPEESFKMALEKVCTSITSGWFREYAWNNYHNVVAIYNKMGKDDYVKRFNNNKDLIRPFK